MSTSRSRIPSPARSLGAPRTPRRYVTPRKSRSVCSPGRSNGPGRLSTLIQEHKDQEENSFVLSPIVRKSVLSDNTDIEMPGRHSWWKNLNDQSRDVFEVLKENAIEPHNIMEELNIEVLSQENKKKYTLDLPDSSDCESIHSIVIPQKRLFNEKENRPQRHFDDFGNRKTLEKTCDTNEDTERTGKAPNNQLSTKPISRPAFPAALLDISANTTVGDRTLAPTIKPRIGLRNMFGTQQAAKRKNMFAKFIESADYSSEEEIADVSEVKKRFFDLPKPGPHRRPSARSSSSKVRDQSPTSNVTTDSFADWDQLPSSTMVENQLEAALTGGNKPKRSKLSKLSEASSPATSDSIKSKLRNKSTTKNKSQVIDKSLPEIDSPNTSQTLNIKEPSKMNTSKTYKNRQSSKLTVDLVESSLKNNKNKDVLDEKKVDDDNIEMDIEEQQEIQTLRDQNTSTLKQTLNQSQTSSLLKRPSIEIIKESVEMLPQNDKEGIINEDIEMTDSETGNKSIIQGKPQEKYQNSNVTETLYNEQYCQSEENKNKEANNIIRKDTGINNVQKQNESQVANAATGAQISEVQNKSKNINVESITPQECQDVELKQVENDEELNEIYNDGHINDDKESYEKNNENRKDKELNENQKEILESQGMENKGSQNITSQEEEEPNESNADNKENEIEDDIENQENESEVEPDDDNEVELTGEDIEETDNQDVENVSEILDEHEMDEESSNQSIKDIADSEPEDENESENKANESQDVSDNEEELEELNEVANESKHESENEANESQHVSHNQEEIDNEAEESYEAVNESVHEEESQHVSDDEEEIENESNKEANESEHESENEENESQPDNEEHMEYESENDQVIESNEDVDTDQNEDNDPIDNTASPDISHDTTGRNRKKPDNVSIEAGVFRPTKELEHSFIGRGRNTSVRKTKSLINPKIDVEKIKENNTRGSLSMSEGKNSSAEGSGWDSHRTTRKTLRQTFGKDFTPRKSLRALVMEKSAKRHTLAKGSKDITTASYPLANSTELAEASAHDYEMHDETAEKEQEVSIRTRKATLEEYLKKIGKEMVEKKAKSTEAVRKQFERPPEPNRFKVPARPMFQRKASQPKLKTSTNIRLKLSVPLEDLPADMQEDLKYKPPKRFAPRNAAWLTKRFYKFVEGKLEAKYDYKARVRAEKFAQTLYGFVQALRRIKVAQPDSVDELKHEMARLKIVKTHFEFYDFFWEFMPREVRVKVIPDLTNNIRQPRAGIFSDILEGDA